MSSLKRHITYVTWRSSDSTVYRSLLPLACGYCHCKNCRTWHAAPLNAWTVWPNEAVRIEQGEELIANYQSRRSNRHVGTVDRA